MFGLYRDVTKTAAQRAFRSWPLAFVLVLYFALFLATGMVVGALGLGQAAGIFLGIVGALCLSSYVHLLSLAVAGTKVRLVDLKESFGRRFGDVLSVLFVLWIIGLVTDLVANGAGPSGPAITAMVAITIALFFNATPELLYQGRSRSLELLMDSARFVMQHPLSWLVPNILIGGVVLAATGELRGISHPGQLVLGLSGLASFQGVVLLMTKVPLVLAPPLLVFVHFAMIFRGLLFRELSTSNPRARAFRRAMGGD